MLVERFVLTEIKIIIIIKLLLPALYKLFAIKRDVSMRLTLGVSGVEGGRFIVISIIRRSPIPIDTPPQGRT